MEAKKPRSPRTLLTASAEITDLHSNKEIKGQTLDVSLGGCYLETPDPLPVRTALRVKLTFNNSSITVFGDVVRSEKGKGMGIKFRSLETAQLATLKGWFFAADRPSLSW